MVHKYDDIRIRIAEEPVWFDSNGTPRYGAFTPDSVPCIYADEAALYEIQCQNCDATFLVSAHSWGFFTGSLADSIMLHQLHYGDPPRHDCTGDTMNCIDLRVVEYWHKPHAGEWTRNQALEIQIEDPQASEGREGG